MVVVVVVVRPYKIYVACGVSRCISATCTQQTSCALLWLLTDETTDGHSTILRCISYTTSCLQCFDTVGWAPGRASGL